jgi:hypothetical protein
MRSMQKSWKGGGLPDPASLLGKKVLFSLTLLFSLSSLWLTWRAGCFHRRGRGVDVLRLVCRHCPPPKRFPRRQLTAPEEDGQAVRQGPLESLCLLAPFHSSVKVCYWVASVCVRSNSVKSVKFFITVADDLLRVMIVAFSPRALRTSIYFLTLFR